MLKGPESPNSNRSCFQKGFFLNEEKEREPKQPKGESRRVSDLLISHLLLHRFCAAIIFSTKLTMALAGCSGSVSANRWLTLSVVLPCFRATKPKSLGERRGRERGQGSGVRGQGSGVRLQVLGTWSPPTASSPKCASDKSAGSVSEGLVSGQAGTQGFTPSKGWTTLNPTCHWDNDKQTPVWEGKKPLEETTLDFCPVICGLTISNTPTP